MPALAPDPINSVVVLKVGGTLEIESQLPTPSDDGSLVLSADAAYIHNNEGSRQARVQHREETATTSAIGRMLTLGWSGRSRLINPANTRSVAELAVEQEKSRFRIELAGPARVRGSVFYRRVWQLRQYVARAS